MNGRYSPLPLDLTNYEEGCSLNGLNRFTGIVYPRIVQVDECKSWPGQTDINFVDDFRYPNTTPKTAFFSMAAVTKRGLRLGPEGCFRPEGKLRETLPRHLLHV